MSRWRKGTVLVAALLAAAGTARLGVWQLDRAAQKNALQATWLSQRALPALAPQQMPRDAADATRLLHRAITLQGQWLAAQSVYLENRQFHGQPGFYVLTPLQLPDRSAVLVQRGWVPRDLLDRTRIAAPPPPAGDVTVSGRIATGPARLYDFAGAASGPIRQNLQLDEFRLETGLPLRPFLLVQDDGAAAMNDGLQRNWPLPAVDVQKHYGYAFQWFALSALIIGLYAWFQLIRPARQHH
jgi:surfeit locus 1 family protein